MESDSPSFFGRHQFLIYRLFSLAGLIPVGAYLVVHLLTNATVIDSPATYQAQVNRIHSLGIILPVVEWTFIFIPILFHAIIGLTIIAGAMPNAAAYPYNGNIRYTLQRATGMIVFAFIIWHVTQMHHYGAESSVGRQIRRSARHLERRRDLIPVFVPPALRHRSLVGRLSLSQRPMDPGHYLGNLDDACGDAPRRIDLRRIRHSARLGRHRVVGWLQQYRRQENDRGRR